MKLIFVMALGIFLIYQFYKTVRWLLRQRKRARSNKKKCVVHSAIATVLAIAIVSLGFTAMAQITQHQEERFIEEIDFESEVINDKDTIWQEMLNINLYYSYLEEQQEKGFSNDEIRKHFIQGIGLGDVLVSVDFQQVYQLYEKFYNTDLLPQTQKTLEEIEILTPPLEERSKADPDLFREEFALRAGLCSEDSSFECLYQTGRSADDAFKRLVENKNIKEIVFFAAMAVSFYRLSLEKLEDNEYLKWSFVEYKIAEIYYYLQDKCNIQDATRTDLYKLHFCLAVEAYLKHSQEMFDLAQSETSIHEEQTYHDQYIAEIQYKLILSDLFKEKDKIKAECRMYATSYIKDSCAKQNGINSCNSYIISLEALDENYE